MRSHRTASLLLIAILLISSVDVLAGQEYTHASAPVVSAAPASGKISIDGRLTEQAWSRALPFSEFRQRDPNEGEKVTERTQLRILYDQRALYVGAELFDSEPSKIVARLSRRDTFPDSDTFTLYLDPYHDHLTGAMFQVSAAGVQFDAVISNDTRQDNSWDSVWESAVSRDETGWFVEMRIPFSQLRFGRAEHYTWGINALRFIHRKNESAWLEMVPRKENGLASRMAHLTGIDNIEPGHNLEIFPYVRASTELSPAVEGNPFRDGSRSSGASGVDIKYGLNSNLTLDATVNPDFGQVEVDPAVVNLSAFETFFQERRPFFIEGSQVFGNFGRGAFGNAGGVVFPQYFYSRRIGRRPPGSASGDFVDQPDATTILGAAKLTGKTKSGWTLGLLNASTASEYAKVITANNRSKVQVEPSANYFVGRMLREIPNRGGFGMLATDVERQLELPALRDAMPKHARVLGADGYYFLDKKRVWTISGRMSGSWLAGNAAAIERIQRASQRYFQRPDATHLRFDPSATSIRGWAGGASFSKTSGGVLLNSTVSGNSPGFDVNDMGFQGASDVWGATGDFTWRQTKPDRVSRNRSISVFRLATWNYANERRGNFTNVFAQMTFRNYWGVNGRFGVGGSALDDKFTRGGPSARAPSNHGTNFGFFSDNRKRFFFGMFGGYFDDSAGSWNSFTAIDLSFKPASSVQINLGPNFERSHNFAQYVKSIDDSTAATTFGKRYVFADLDQSEVSLNTRVNWGLSPKMSLQVYSQMLVSAGDYWGFKEFERPRAFSFLRYGQSVGMISRAGREYTVDPDGPGPGATFTFSDPNFNFKSLRANAVFRWEWRPGTTLYVVWQHNQSDNRFPGSISPSRDLRALFGAPSNNIFLVKTSYWFNR